MDFNSINLPVHTAESCQGPSTLVASTADGAGPCGPVRVWAPDKWRHWLACSVAPLTLFPGLVAAVWVAVVLHIPIVLLKIFLVISLLSWLFSKFRRFRNYSYLATDNHGISMNSPRSSRYLAWKNIIKVIPSAGFPRRPPQWRYRRRALWAAAAPVFFLVECMTAGRRVFGGVDLSVRTPDGMVDVNLAGHSRRHCLELLDLIAEQANLMPSDDSHALRVTYVKCPALAAGPETPDALG